MRVVLFVTAGLVLAACAQPEPVYFASVNPNQYATANDRATGEAVAGARCGAVAMNNMGPPAIPRAPPPAAPVQLTAVATTNVILNAPTAPGQANYYDAARPDVPVILPKSVPPPPIDIDWNAIHENEIRRQRGDANFYACMADAGFVRSAGP